MHSERIIDKTITIDPWVLKSEINLDIEQSNFLFHYVRVRSRLCYVIKWEKKGTDWFGEANHVSLNWQPNYLFKILDVSNWQWNGNWVNSSWPCKVMWTAYFSVLSSKQKRMLGTDIDTVEILVQFNQCHHWSQRHYSNGLEFEPSLCSLLH